MNFFFVLNSWNIKYTQKEIFGSGLQFLFLRMRVIISNYREKDKASLIEGIPRFCYRSNFKPIQNTKLDCDSGWGCCFRSSQGLICQYIMKLSQNNPEIYNRTFPNTTNPLELFRDLPESPFGIQNLVRVANEVGLPMGEWIKPSLMAETIFRIFKSLNLNCIIARNLSFDCEELTKTGYPTLMLIPGLLGLDKLEEDYIPFIYLCLCIENSLGFVSGLGSSAYYFVAFDVDQIYYFDPHTTKKALVGTDFNSLFELKLKSMNIKKLNPSILFGFYCEEVIKEEIFHLTGCTRTPITVIDKANLEEITKDVIDLD